MKKILYTIGLCLLAASCSEDYTDWANPLTHAQKPIETSGLSITAPEALDVATVTGESVQLFAPTRARMYVIYAPALIRFHKEQPDLAADSLAADSLLADSLRFRTDTLQQRLTPEQRREQQDVERTIDVVREKPYQAPRRGGKKRFTQPRRR